MTRRKRRPRLPVVGSCPACGRPIYGEPSIRDGDTPVVVASCTCSPRRPDLDHPPPYSKLDWGQFADPDHPNPLEPT